ncbi:Retrovirus-related Pol polyprotein from transposon 17.6, partial [Mucuna pruriens]
MREIHIALANQHKTKFTYPFDTFAYTKMPFSLCNASCMEVFIDDFTMYGSSFDACLESSSRGLDRCIETNLVLNFEKCHFMVTKGIVSGHQVSNKGVEVVKAKIDIIASLSHPTYMRFIQNFIKIAFPMSKLLHQHVEFVFNHPCIEAFQELKKRLTTIPIL